MRLEGRAKAGFYPTPKNVVQDIIKFLDIKGNCKILDASCGNGDALADIKKAFPQVTTYGVELSEDRYNVAKTQVDHCLNCDSMNELRASNNAFDILWENPPYDDDIRDEYGYGNSNRTEVNFFNRHIKYLRDDGGGIVIYIIPILSLLYVGRSLAKTLTDIHVYAFPAKDYAVFKQVVIVGRRVAKDDIDFATESASLSYLQGVLNYAYYEDATKLMVTTDAVDAKKFQVIASYHNNISLFQKNIINPDEIVPLIKDSSLFRSFKQLTTLETVSSIKPLTDLSEGHLAMLIAAGMIDGRLESNGEQLVIKGLVEEGEQSWTEEDDDKKVAITRKTYTIKVNILNLTTEKMMRVVA